MAVVVHVLAAVLMLVGAGLVLSSAVVMFRARDALTRTNGFGPSTALGLPCLVLGGYLESLLAEGFALGAFVRLLITLGALVVVSSVATNTLSRASYLSGAPVDPRTHPQDLAAEPPRD